MRFALASLVAFAGIGAAITVLTTRQVVHTQEENAQQHAEFVGSSILRDQLTPADVRAPLRGRALRRLDAFVRSHILLSPVVRVKIWSLRGEVLYSDEPRIIGMLFPGEPDAAEGDAESEVSDLSDAENRFERNLAPKLFSTYVPLYLGKRRTGRPDAVAELYQDYVSIEAKADELKRTAIVTLALGLVFLYLLLLPILMRVATRLRQQNDQLEDQARRLQEQASRLQASLAKEQESVAELTRLNQMKGDFVAVASHELRTPLTAILGYVKTLRRPEFEGDAAARAEFLAAIERQGDRLFRLVTNLLTAAQVENREAPPDVSEVDLREVAEEIREGFHQGGARIEVVMAPTLPSVRTDRIRVGEILANLVDNALKYSADGTAVEIGAEPAADGDWIRLWVADHGVGIAQGDLERIFERFFQADQSATRRFGGVGLGLHLVKELATALGGWVEVQSAPGAGSTFAVMLPLDRSDEEAGAAGAPEMADAAPRGGGSAR
jgi:signal transduction histidine kinase